MKGYFFSKALTSACAAAMRDRKRSALSLLLSTKPRRLLARSPSRGAGGMGGDSSATVGSSVNRMFSAPDQAVDTYWIQSNPNGYQAQWSPRSEERRVGKE